MTSKIALTICIVFIVYLFINDAKRKPDISWALWVPLLLILILASRPVSQWLGVGVVLTCPEDYLEGNPLERNIRIVFIVVGFIILFRRKANWSNIIKNNKFIFLYIVYLGLSTLWSDYTFVSFKRWIRELNYLIMVLIILTESNPLESLKTILKRLTYVVIPLSIVLNKYFPELSRMYSISGGEPQYTGVTTHKNALGQLVLVCGLFIFWNLYIMLRNKSTQLDKKEILIHILFSTMIVTLLITARSATAIGSMIIGVSIIVFLGRPFIRRNPRQLKYYIVFFAILLITMHFSFDLFNLSTSTLGRDETLTGRTQIWEEVLKMNTNPFIGTGFDSFWLGERSQYFWDKYWWHPNQSHNGYLETYINLGFIGLFLLIAMIIAVFKNISKNMLLKNNYDYQILRLSIVILFIVMNITEATTKAFMWLIFLLFAIEWTAPPQNTLE